MQCPEIHRVTSCHYSGLAGLIRYGNDFEKVPWLSELACGPHLLHAQKSLFQIYDSEGSDLLRSKKTILRLNFFGGSLASGDPLPIPNAGGFLLTFHFFA